MPGRPLPGREMSSSGRRGGLGSLLVAGGAEPFADAEMARS